jgi:hypothetical protein
MKKRLGYVFNSQYMEIPESTEKRWKAKSIVAFQSENRERIPSNSGENESQGNPLNDVYILQFFLLCHVSFFRDIMDW